MISQKATILCVYEILKKYTDENHIISAEKIREKLKLIYDVDMVFGGINPNQYAIKYILNKGENVLQFEFECDTNVWDELV